MNTANTSLLKKIESFKDYLSICNNSPSEILATIALNNLEKFVKPNIVKIKTNLQIFDEFSNNTNLFHFQKPKSGSTAFVKLNRKETAMEFAENLVQHTGIMLLPSDTFEYGTTHLRIGFGRKNMKDVLEILSSYITSI
ncbi:MAG: hypothetical protein EAZ51_00005 [Sphingobacteriales bacterium]|nr:MAG: hypothetical protein EAZ64_01060 [Sphingobacteriales bacterium]TAF84033.1 MAG: hypothetical protein EAZ51_00005 [Sphingobacteriales bacterium]